MEPPTSDRLVHEVDGDGVLVTLERRGEDRQLPPGIDLSVYRIVQEALTNVRRHAGRPVAVLVTLTPSPELSSSRSPTTGAGRAGPTPGHGLVGMRERATFFGGTFDAGTPPEGGFRVRASFPLPEAP